MSHVIKIINISPSKKRGRIIKKAKIESYDQNYQHLAQKNRSHDQNCLVLHINKNKTSTKLQIQP